MFYLRLDEPKPVLSYRDDDGAGELEPVLPPQPPLFDLLELLREPLALFPAMYPAAAPAAAPAPAPLQKPGLQACPFCVP